MEADVPENGRLRIAALADLHFGSPAAVRPDLGVVAAGADVLLIGGDLTDHGSIEEAEGLAKELSKVHVPMIAVLGNHDYEAGKPEEVKRILTDAGVTVLDGDACVIGGVGFAGAKGFAGGFGRGTLEPWGESAVKVFVQEAMDEALKLEKALSRLRTDKTIALLHYAPVQSTVEGEPPVIFPFLGCTRLEEPLNRYSVTAAFHGHAHRGAPEGKTTAGVPVYNVSLPLLRSAYPDQPPVRWLEVDCKTDDVAAGHGSSEQMA
jgi:Icc-related predicted phosphoesterase